MIRILVHFYTRSALLSTNTVGLVFAFNCRECKVKSNLTSAKLETLQAMYSTSEYILSNETVDTWALDYKRVPLKFHVRIIDIYFAIRGSICVSFSNYVL